LSFVDGLLHYALIQTRKAGDVQHALLLMKSFPL
jgi:hypothetical protein